MCAGHHLEQGGLAGAVVAEQRGDLAGLDLEVDAVERLHEAVAELDAGQAEAGGGVGHLKPPEGWSSWKRERAWSRAPQWGAARAASPPPPTSRARSRGRG